METYNLDDYKRDNFGDAPAVYVGTYAKYNNNDLSGAWLDLTKFYDFDEFMDVCAYLHRDEDEPEFMFQDWENVPSEWQCESDFDETMFDRVNEWYSMDDEEKDAFEAFMSAFFEDDIDSFREHYEGQFDDMEEFARHIAEETGLLTLPSWVNIPTEIRRQFDTVAGYFNFAAYADELEYDYTWADGYVFRN